MQETFEQAVARFWARVEKGGSCWLWLGCLDRYGYGQFGYRNKNWRAHRFAYLTRMPDLPQHDRLDHECDNRACVNPDHLRPLSQRANVLRSKTNPVAINARRTHCAQGHEFTPENTGRSVEGWRFCKTCKKNGMKSPRRRLPRKTGGKIETPPPKPPSTVETDKERIQREYIERMTKKPRP
jgi:hypothetical protein